MLITCLLYNIVNMYCYNLFVIQYIDITYLLYNIVDSIRWARATDAQGPRHPGAMGHHGWSPME